MTSVQMTTNAKIAPASLKAVNVIQTHKTLMNFVLQTKNASNASVWKRAATVWMMGFAQLVKNAKIAPAFQKVATVTQIHQQLTSLVLPTRNASNASAWKVAATALMTDSARREKSARTVFAYQKVATATQTLRAQTISVQQTRSANSASAWKPAATAWTTASAPLTRNARTVSVSLKTATACQMVMVFVHLITNARSVNASLKIANVIPML